MKKWFITGLLALGFLGGHAQQYQLSDLGCGTVTTPEEIQAVADYVSGKVQFKRTNSVDTIPLSIHIVGKNDGTGYYRLDYLFSVLCDLNTRYTPVGFYFYVKWPIHYINNTNFYDHDYSSGYQMMFQNNVPNTANVYFVQDPSGACGYFAPFPDGVAIKKDCSNPNSTTLVHELGHYFGLPHTFVGWENGATPSTPEKVIRGAGANCNSAGDHFCDTDADYLAERWNCPYTGNKKDQNGDYYHPDSSLYMSYSTDNCMSRFSNQQIGRMQSNLYNQRPNLLQGTPTGTYSISAPGLVYPTDTMYSNKKLIKWNKVPGADYYYVKINYLNGTASIEDTLTADTSFSVSKILINNTSYKITVVPVSSVNVCMNTQTVQNVVYSNGTALGVSDLSAEVKLSVYPNPASHEVTLEFGEIPAGFCNIELVNISGQKVFTTSEKLNYGRNKISVPTSNLPSGIYMLRATGEGFSKMEKLVIHH